MAAPLSEDLRRRIVAAVNGGMSRRAAAERFGVSASSAIRFVALEKATGSVTHKPMGGHQPMKLRAHAQAVLDLVADEPDLTLCEMQARLAQAGIAVGYGGLWRFLAAEKITVKKKPARCRAGPSRRGPGPCRAPRAPAAA